MTRESGRSEETRAGGGRGEGRQAGRQTGRQGRQGELDSWGELCGRFEQREAKQKAKG